MLFVLIFILLYCVISHTLSASRDREYRILGNLKEELPGVRKRKHLAIKTETRNMSTRPNYVPNLGHTLTSDILLTTVFDTTRFDTNLLDKMFRY